jgi:hypothetical protein
MLKTILKTMMMLMLLNSIGFASKPFQIGDAIGTFSLANQFDKKQTIDASVRTILVSFQKDTGANVNAFLTQQKADFLSQHHAVFIANISGMPMIITKMFALPKMRNYEHSILLIYDENDQRFESQEGKTTVYKLDKGVIQHIDFITHEALSSLFQ